MMQLLRNPKNVKLVSLFIAAVFVIGCFALSITQSGFGKVVQAASSESAIGVVNTQLLFSQSPDTKAAEGTLRQFMEETQKDFNEKSKAMNDQEKQRYYAQCQQRVEAKQRELTEPIQKKIEAAIQKVAKKKGLSVVVEKRTVVYGGVDITDEVAKDLQSGK